MKLRIVVSCLALAACACAPSGGEIVEVAASAQEAFRFPYFLWIPEGAPGASPTFLLVEPNNTGKVSDDFEEHRRAAREMVEHSSISAFVARELGLPLLVPVFPRPESDTILRTEEPLVRLDRQLSAMIDHARSLLASRGIEVDERVLMNGFSASGTFSNRFTFLHPERVRAIACGGINAIPMLPVERFDDTELPYPLGLADFEAVAGVPFRRDAWDAIPQFLYMGADDDNDAVAYADGYSDDEREIVHTVIGETMMPDRWETCRSVYASSGANATLRTYDGIGHGTDDRINGDVVEFFRSAIASGR